MNKPGFAIGTSVFLRVLALVHAAAFLSAWVQIGGLIGPHGLLPADRFFGIVQERLGTREAVMELPSLCWFLGAGRFLHVLCGAGVALSALLFAGVAPAPCLALLWVCYLSLAGAGQIFFAFQWDNLLLETTLLAVFLAPWRLLPGWSAAEPPRIALWLLGWLLFRLMFLSGVVKLASGDPAWRHLSALSFHFQSQPLPTPLAWYANRLPRGVGRACCAAMFAIELAAPFALLAGRRLRHAAVLAMIALQVLIALTGNYAYFNLLCAALCLPWLDDRWWGGTRPRPAGPGPSRWVLFPFAAFALVCTLCASASLFAPRAGASLAGSLVRAVAPLRSFNTYGLFAVMTTRRPELVLEGSDDGIVWKAYGFRHKPGDPSRRPDFVAPHQPRLDWQLWFAALGPLDGNRWVIGLCEHVLKGTPEVLALLGTNPFPGKPPLYIRVVRYEYSFASPAERMATGDWWTRKQLDTYLPPSSLD
jgi:lipase maturation factor 1